MLSYFVKCKTEKIFKYFKFAKSFAYNYLGDIWPQRLDFVK